MDIPKLDIVKRDREYSAYPKDIKDKVVYQYLFKNKSHRQIDEEILEINPDYSRGWQSMGILHHLGLKNDFKGIFSEHDINSAIRLLQDKDSEYYKKIIQSLNRYVNNIYPDNNTDYFIPNPKIKPLFKNLGSSQYTDGVRIDKEFHDIFNPKDSKYYTTRGTARKIKILFNNKIFDAEYRYEGQTDTSVNLQSIRFREDLKAEFKRTFPNESGRFKIQQGYDLNHFIFDIVDEEQKEHTNTSTKRNPHWTRDELILALNVYFSVNIHNLSSSDDSIVELSNLLNRLNAYEDASQTRTYRNHNGVHMKLMNFYSIENPGKGLTNYSKLDKTIFDEFHEDKSSLKAAATRIIETINNDDKARMRILDIQRECLIHLFKLQSQNSDFRFVPRRVGYKDRTHEAGYYFLGNNEYLLISFWLGQDTLKRVHNISFVVTETGSSYIELSYEKDNQEKREYLLALAKNIEDIMGEPFVENTKNQLQLEYSTLEYLINLDDFITRVKPIIDDFILTNESEITLPDEDFNDKYVVPLLRYIDKSEVMDDEVDEKEIRPSMHIRRLHHKKIQERLVWILNNEYSKSGCSIQSEVDYVDVVMSKQNGEKSFYEIKTFDAKNSIRQALGQLLEYCHYPEGKKAEQLIVVSESELTDDDKKYLTTIENHYSIHIYYQQIDLKHNKLIKLF